MATVTESNLENKLKQVSAAELAAFARMLDSLSEDELRQVVRQVVDRVDAQFRVAEMIHVQADGVLDRMNKQLNHVSRRIHEGA